MRALRRSGLKVEVDHAVDGQAAVDYLARRKKETGGGFPDLVLLDIRLPHLSGFEVHQWLATNSEPKKQPRTIFLTNSENPSDQQKAQQLSAGNYWIKPASLKGYSKLMEQIQSQLPRKSTLPRVGISISASRQLDTQNITGAEKEFFIAPAAANLRKAIRRQQSHGQEVPLLIVGIRGRKPHKKSHFGLAGFSLS